MAKYSCIMVNMSFEDSSKIEKYVVEFSYSDESESADNPEKRLESILINLGIDKRKVMGMVSDNGSNMFKLVDQMNFPRMACMTHRLNLSAKITMEKFPVSE